MPSSNISAPAPATPTGENAADDSETQEGDTTAPTDSIAEGGVPAEDAPTRDEDGEGQLRAAGTSPSLAWASPGEEETSEAGGGGATMDGKDGVGREVERLWCRIDKVENRIYQRRADERRLQVCHVEHAGGHLVAVVIGLLCSSFYSSFAR